MRRWIRRISLLAAILVLATTLAAACEAYEVPVEFENQTLEEAMDDFMAAYGLREGNFSVSYYHPATGEAYVFCDDTFMVAGSTYKLPLNMYYYELERDGELASDAYIAGAGTTLDNAHYQSLVCSDNDISIGLLYNLGNFSTYKTLMRKYFTMTDEEIDQVYYTSNSYCTRMMMDALTYLYEHSEDFEEMLGYMQEAQPGAYFKTYVTDYPVAHKYGWFEGAVNDVGIIYTPEPFLLAVYTQDVSGEEVVGRAAELFRNYTLWQISQQPEPEPVPVPVPAESMSLELTEVPKEDPGEEFTEESMEEPEPPVTEPDPVPEPEPEPESAFEWWMVAVALGVFLAGGGLVLLLFRPKHMGKYEKRYQKRFGDRVEK